MLFKVRTIHEMWSEKILEFEVNSNSKIHKFVNSQIQKNAGQEGVELCIRLLDQSDPQGQIIMAKGYDGRSENLQFCIKPFIIVHQPFLNDFDG